MLAAVQAVQGCGSPALLAAALRLVLRSLSLQLRHQGPSALHGLFGAFCTALTSTAAAVAAGSGSGGRSDSPGAAAGGCPGEADASKQVQSAAMALVQALNPEFAMPIFATAPWRQLPPRQVLGALEALVAAAAACCPTAGCPAGCPHPLHGTAAAVLRSLHMALNTHLDLLRGTLPGADFARLVGITCGALGASLAAGHDLLDGMLSSPAAAQQVVDRNLRQFTDVYYSCRHIGRGGAGWWWVPAHLPAPCLGPPALPPFPACAARRPSCPAASPHQRTHSRSLSLPPISPAAYALCYELPAPPVTEMEQVLEQSGVGARLSQPRLPNPQTGAPNRLRIQRLIPQFLQAGWGVQHQGSAIATWGSC